SIAKVVQLGCQATVPSAVPALHKALQQVLSALGGGAYTAVGGLVLAWSLSHLQHLAPPSSAASVQPAKVATAVAHQSNKKKRQRVAAEAPVEVKRTSPSIHQVHHTRATTNAALGTVATVLSVCGSWVPPSDRLKITALVHASQRDKTLDPSVVTKVSLANVVAPDAQGARGLALPQTMQFWARRTSDGRQYTKKAKGNDEEEDEDDMDDEKPVLADDGAEQDNEADVAVEVASDGDELEYQDEATVENDDVVEEPTVDVAQGANDAADADDGDDDDFPDIVVDDDEADAKYAPPQEDGGYATLADTSLSGHPPAAPSVGRVSVSRSHNWSTKLPSASAEYGDDDGALTADNVDKAPSHRNAVTRPRYSSVSSSAKQPDEPYETPQTYALTDGNLNKIKRAGDDIADVIEDIGEPSTAQ
ncbi:hypothetical protein DYB34_014023, partial [Aphanomyces astaci]